MAKNTTSSVTLYPEPHSNSTDSILEQSIFKGIFLQNKFFHYLRELNRSEGKDTKKSGMPRFFIANFTNLKRNIFQFVHMLFSFMYRVHSESCRSVQCLT